MVELQENDLGIQLEVAVALQVCLQGGYIAFVHDREVIPSVTSIVYRFFESGCSFCLDLAKAYIDTCPVRGTQYLCSTGVEARKLFRRLGLKSQCAESQGWTTLRRRVRSAVGGRQYVVRTEAGNEYLIDRVTYTGVEATKRLVDECTWEYAVRPPHGKVVISDPWGVRCVSRRKLALHLSRACEL